MMANSCLTVPCRVRFRVIPKKQEVELMKRVAVFLLVLALSVGFASVAFADATGTLTSADPAAGKVEVTLTVNDTFEFDSCKVDLTQIANSKLTLWGVKVTAKGADVTDVSAADSADDVKDLTSMFAWNAATGKIAYASSGKIKVSEMTFTLTFDIAEGADTSSEKVDAVIVFFDSTKTSGTKELNATATGDVKVTVKAYKLGDVDGDGSITSKDALYTALLANGLYTKDTSKVKNYDGADVNGDGEITSKDALWIALYAIDIYKFVSE